MRRWLRLTLLVLLGLSLVACPVSALVPLPATPTPTYSVSVCAEGCAFRSIAEALDAGADDILLTDPLYEAVELVIDRRVVIRAQTKGATALQAGESAETAAGRLFHIKADGDLYLHGLTLQHGQPTEATRDGGLVYSLGSLTAYDCVFRDGLGNDGGALLNRGSARLIRCWFDDNHADGQAPPETRCGSGGAIKSETGSTLYMLNCSLSNNEAVEKGGAIHVSCDAQASLYNVTLAGNEAKDRGGGLSLHGEGRLEHCTVAYNRAAGGGGVNVRGTLTSVASLYAENSSGGDLIVSGDGGYKGMGEAMLQGANMVLDGNVAGAMGGPAGLGAFGNVGGWVPCIPLLPGSAAIDQVPVGNSILPTDARGAERFVTYLGSSSRAKGDLGAYELQPESTGVLGGLWRRVTHLFGGLAGR